MAKKKVSDNTVCRNRKAAHRFVVLEKVECGMVLLGTEIKSLRDQGPSLDESFARIDGGELWLIDCHIAPYAYGHTTNHEARRRRKLLVHGRQLDKLQQKVTQKGMTLVPLRIYFNDRGLAKLTLAVARGKSQGDKREGLKARDHQRDIERAMRKHR